MADLKDDWLPGQSGLTGAVNDAAAKVNALDALTGPGGRLSASELENTMGVVVGDVQRALASFTARVAGRDGAPVVVVVAGTSTIAGTGASSPSLGFTQLLSDALQATFPLASGAPSPVMRSLADAVTTPPSAPGVQVVYSSVGGGRSDTYLTATTRGQIATLNPALVLHLVQANDARNNVAPATYKTNMAAQVDDIAARVAKPVTQIVVSQAPQSDAGFAPTHSYDLYTQALREIADARPDSVLFTDTVNEFAAVGVTGGTGGADPLGVVSGDLIHPSNNGHALTADIVRRAVSWSTPRPSSAAPATPQPVSFYRIWSDSFTTDGEVNGRTVDAFQGGATPAWVASATSRFATASGMLQPTATVANAMCGVAVPAGDVQVSTLVDTSPTDGALILALNMQNTAGDTTNVHARFSYNPSTGVLALQKRYGGNTFTIASATVAAGYCTGKVLTLRRFRNTFYALVDGVVLFTATTDSVPDAGTAGYFRAGGSSGTPKYAWIVADALT